jgi:transcriptional regulator with XRE-family HTH domain
VPAQRPSEHLQTLGRRLRGLRETAGLSGKNLAKQLGWQPSKISRIELARQSASPADITEWVAATGARAEERSTLLGLLDQSREDQQTNRQRTRHGQAAMQAGYNALAERSTLIRQLQTAVVPGILQTSDYARAILTAASRLHEVPVPDVEEAVATRMARQQYLYSPRRFEFLIAEPVLRWGVAPPNIMRAQIDRLQSVVGLPNVRLGIIPLGAPLAFVPLHSFEMFDDLVCVESVARENRYTGTEVEPYVRVFSALWQSAATGDDARRLLVRIADET